MSEKFSWSAKTLVFIIFSCYHQFVSPIVIEWFIGSLVVCLMFRILLQTMGYNFVIKGIQEIQEFEDEVASVYENIFTRNVEFFRNEWDFFCAVVMSV